MLSHDEASLHAVNGAGMPYHDEAEESGDSRERSELLTVLINGLHTCFVVPYDDKGGDVRQAESTHHTAPRQGDARWCWISAIPHQIKGSFRLRSGTHEGAASTKR